MLDICSNPEGDTVGGGVFVREEDGWVMVVGEMVVVKWCLMVVARNYGCGEVEKVGEGNGERVVGWKGCLYTI